MMLLLDVVNDKEDLVACPRFIGNICLHTNGGKMSLKMRSWKGYGESIVQVVFCWNSTQKTVDQPDANPESTRSEVESALFVC